MSVNSIIGTPIDQSTNSDLFKNLLRQIWDSTDRPAETYWRDLCLAETTGDEYEREMRLAGFEYGGEVPEGQPIPIGSPKYGSTLDWSQVSYASGFRVTDRMDKFNKWKLTAKWTKNLKRNAEEMKDVEIAKMFNNPTSTTYAVGYDTLSLANGSHTCLDDSSTTYDNLIGSALSTATLQSMYNYFNYMYDDMGQVFRAKPSHLVYAPALNTTAHELMGGPLKPHELSNTNNVNTSLYPHALVDYIRLTSSTAWFAIAKNHDLYDIKVFTSQEADLKSKDAPDTTRDMIYTSQQYFKYGYGDPRMYVCGNT